MSCSDSEKDGDSEKSESALLEPGQQRVVLEPGLGTKVPDSATWKDVGRRFQELEKERADMLKVMQNRASNSE
jgi:hypothetical protein